MCPDSSGGQSVTQPTNLKYEGTTLSWTASTCTGNDCSYYIEWKEVSECGKIKIALQINISICTGVLLGGS